MLSRPVDRNDIRNFAKVIDIIEIPMLITDPTVANNPIIACNPAFERLTGYARDEVLGRNCRMLQGPNTAMDTVKKISDALAGGYATCLELINYRKNGTAFWNSLSINPLHGQDKRIIAFVASQLDVTAHKIIESELLVTRQQAQSEIEKLNQALRDETACKLGLIHELDHRVKNTLSTVTAIVKAHTRHNGTEEGRNTALRILNRVEALGIVQRRLFPIDDALRFEVSKFMRDLVSERLASPTGGLQAVKLDLTTVYLPASYSTPLALIINELVSEALSNAADTDLPVHVSLKLAERRASIEVSRSGSEDSPERTRFPISMTLIEKAARQLCATIVSEHRYGCSSVTVSFIIDGP